MMTTSPFCSSTRVMLSALAVTALTLTACDRLRNNDSSSGAGLVVDAAVAATTTEEPDAGPIDVMQCQGCLGASASGWTFEGVYRDANCTEPLAQSVLGSCATVPSLGQVSLTYVDEVGLRKANEPATVTLTEQVGAEATRYRKSGKACVRANEGAVALTPSGCADQRVCRDEGGALGCGTCRTLTGGCPDHEETRLYAAIDDPGLKAKAAGGTGSGLGRLGQCCSALAAEARRLGPSPEAGVLAGAAAQCTALVAQAGPNGNAPELGALKSLLAGRKVPAICSGL